MTMYDVFISYRRSDGSALAETLANYLRAKGLRVFFDRNEIKDSQDFKDRIESSLRQAPNYLLVASTAAFRFYTDQEDWVKREMEIACENYDGNAGRGRVITVVAPDGAVIPKEEELPETIRVLANPNRIMLRGELPADNEKLRVLRAVTQVNRHNLWNAGHRWLEESKKAGGRFSVLDINESLFPNAAKREAESRRRGRFPIFVQPGQSPKKRKPLMEALGENRDHVYLIGQGGIGKTTTLVHIMNEAYGEGQVYGENCQIPLFVSLSSAPDTYGALYEGGKSTFIRRAIYKQVREDRTVKKVSRQEVAKLDEAFTIDPQTAVEPVVDLLSKETAAPEYLLLLDGLNEVSRNQIEEAGRSVIQMILREINWLITDCPNVRLIITGRADEAMIHGDRLTRFSLSGLEKPVIRQYLSTCECDEEKITRVFQNDALLETLRVPLFLVMYANLRENEEISTQGEILRTFLNEHKDALQIYTAQGRLSQVEEDVDSAASAMQKLRITSEMQCFMLDFLLPEIAWYMEQRGLFALDEETVAQIIEPVLTGREDTDICGRYGKQIFTKYCSGGSAKTHTRKTAKDILSKLGEDMEEVTESVIDCCIFSLGLLNAGGGKYSFVHQHIRDYFAAQKVINHLWLAVCLYNNEQEDTAYDCLAGILGDKPLRLTLRRFVGETLGEHKNKPRLLEGKWRYMVPQELCRESLITNSLHILRGRPCEGDYILNNLIHIIHEVRGELSGEDLSSLDFSNCSLNRKRLSRLDLAASVENAVIHNRTLFSNVHTDLIRDGSFSPNPELFITASRDGTMKLWNIGTGECVKTVPAHKGGVSEYYHIAKRSVIITAGEDAIKFWDDTALEMIAAIPVPETERLWWCSLYPNGKYFTYWTRTKDQARTCTIRILDVDTRTVVDRFVYEGKGTLRLAALCEDTRYLLANYYLETASTRGQREDFFVLYDRETKIWTELNDYKGSGNLERCENLGCVAILNAGKLRLEDPVGKAAVMEAEVGSKPYRFSAWEDSVLFTVSQNDEAQFWDIPSGSVIASFKASGFRPFKGAICKKRSRFALHEGSTVLIYDYKNEKLLCRIDSFWLRVQSACFSGDAEKLLLSSGNEAVQIWEREGDRYRCKALVMHDSGNFMFAQWTKNDTHCLVSYKTKNKKDRLRCFDTATDRLLQSRDMIRVRGHWYCPDSHTLFVERNDKKSPGQETVIEQYDLETFQLLQTWAFPGDYSVGCIRPDGKQFLLVYKRDRNAQTHKSCVYDAQSRCFTGEIVTDDFVGEFRYAPDGETIIATGREKLYFYDGRSCECLRELAEKEMGHTFDIRPDGAHMACALDRMVCIWNLNTLQVVKSLPHPHNWIPRVEYAPNGRKLITATADGAVFIWDADTYECLQSIPNVPGLFIQGVDLRGLAPQSDITEENKQLLGLYGAVTENET